MRHAVGTQHRLPGPLSLSKLLTSSLYRRPINSPCRGQPLVSVHPVESGSISTGEPSSLCKCGPWDTERDVQAGSLPSASLQLPLFFS